MAKVSLDICPMISYRFRMTEFNEDIGLVQSQNKARLYDTRLKGLQKENTELTGLVNFVRKWLVENLEDVTNNKEFNLRADSADLLHRIDNKLKKIRA